MSSSDRSVTHALDGWPQLIERLKGRPLAVFLDYDGTLVPIAARPDLAILDSARRARLELAAQAWPTFVLSGRGREDVTQMLGIAAIQCIGAHGLDLGANPPLELMHQLDGVPRLIDAAEHELSDLANTVPGLLIENKRVVLAVHYRMVDDSWFGQIERRVDQFAARWPALRKTTGKKVLELRPNLDWNKGSALRWLLASLPAAEHVIPIFVGDDTTDEDAFEAIADRGIGIVVDARRPTAARYAVRDVAEVYELLGRITQLAGENSPGSGEDPVL